MSGSRLTRKEYLKLRNWVRQKFPDPSEGKSEAEIIMERSEAARLHNNHFSRAAHAGKLVRQAMQLYLSGFFDATASQRMMKFLMQVVKTGRHEGGDVLLNHADWSLLKGFQFNASSWVSDVFYVPVEAAIHRGGGSVTIDIPSFIPSNVILFHNNISHYQFICAVAEIDFDNNSFETTGMNSKVFRVGREPSAIIHEVHKLKSNSKLPLFVLFGLRFYGEAGRDRIPIYHSHFTCREILSVDVL